MSGNNHRPGLGGVLHRMTQTCLGLIKNRVELLSVEWQEERLRAAEVLMWGVSLAFLAMMAAMLVTATIIFLFPPGWRLYVTGGFAALYLAGALRAWFVLKTLLRDQPFSETLHEVKKDREWLDSLK